MTRVPIADRADVEPLSAPPPLRLHPLDLVGVLLAAATAAVLARAGHDLVAIAPLAAAAAAAPALARIDLAERRLPNALTLPLLAVAAAACAVRFSTGDLAPLVGLGCGALLLVMAVAGGMGMGDVKLGAGLALATATLGWAVPLVALAASVVVGGVAGAVALAAGRRSVAFGPWLLVGAALAVWAAALRVV
ncbi:prepilin peptidase [Agrococcus carbonis]|uniref:Type IV leader peptidase family protein n=1 Tax=Agrococcus carbonis TaxID=684552 RepID=A0A1H1RS83_9MICO|nr:prepilin peptidase [Agrococcus carbonis]SDS38543.1 Type IV leader peptidase family protein [Agrococcus carbonis]